MRAIFKTKSNYNDLNGRELDVVEIVGTRVSCLVFSSEFMKDVIIDFGLSEVVKFTTGATFNVTLGCTFGQPSAATEKPHGFNVFTSYKRGGYDLNFRDAHGQIIAHIPCEGEDVRNLRKAGFLDAIS